MSVKLGEPIRNNITIMKFDRDGITEIVLKNCHSQIIKKYFDLTIEKINRVGRISVSLSEKSSEQSFRVYIRIDTDIFLSKMALDNIQKILSCLINLLICILSLMIII